MSNPYEQHNDASDPTHVERPNCENDMPSEQSPLDSSCPRPSEVHDTSHGALSRAAPDVRVPTESGSEVPAPLDIADLKADWPLEYAARIRNNSRSVLSLWNALVCEVSPDYFEDLFHAAPKININVLAGTEGIAENHNAISRSPAHGQAIRAKAVTDSDCHVARLTDEAFSESEAVALGEAGGEGSDAGNRSKDAVQASIVTAGLLQRFGFHQSTTHRWTFDEDIASYRQLGVRTIGAWRFKVEDFGADRALDLLKDQGMTVSSLSWAGGFAYSDGEAYEAAVADAIEAVEMTRRIEASTLVVLPGTRGSYTVNHGRRMIIEALRKVGDAAQTAGIQIALQPVDPDFAGDGCFLDSLDRMLDFLLECRHPQIGLNLDVFHLRKTPRLLERIPELIPWIRLVQLSDCRNPRTELDRCMLGDGHLPLIGLLETLEMSGYRGYYDISLMSKQYFSHNYSDVLSTILSRIQSLIPCPELLARKPNLPSIVGNPILEMDPSRKIRARRL